MTLGVNDNYNDPMIKRIKITDQGAATSYRVNSPAGEYGILYATASLGTGHGGGVNKALLNTSSTHTASVGGVTYWRAGLIYYQAGVIALTSSILSCTGSRGGRGFLTLGGTGSFLQFDSAPKTLTGSIVTNEISASADFLRNRIFNLQFNNTIELNSTVYFCKGSQA